MSVAAAVFTAATFLSASGSHECHNVLAIDFFSIYCIVLLHNGISKKIITVPEAMKRYLLLLLCAFVAVCVNAQEKKFNYQGEAVLGYSFGLEEDFHYVKIDVINGVRFSRCFFAGAGIGISQNFSDEEFYIPIYFNAKGYFPVAKNLDLMAGVDIGTKIDYVYETSGGLLLQPMFGICTAMHKNFALNIALKYEFYSYRINDIAVNSKLQTNQVGISLGFVF